MTKSLNQLWAKGTKFLGTEHAILGGAMSWVSERNLVAAISNAGGFGVIACGAMPPELLEKEIIAAKALTNKPFGVNLITMHPKLNELAEICLRHKVTHVVLAGGLPSGKTISKLKDGNAKVLCFAPAVALVKKLVKSGTDAIIIEGSEAGGHIGPVSTSVLAQEILPYVNEEFPEIPVFIAGGIGRGEAIVEFLRMGASGVQLGTRFVCATESIAHPNFKEIFIKSDARDAMPSVQVDPDLPVIPVRAIENEATKDFMQLQVDVAKEFREGRLDKQSAQLKVEHFWAGALRRAVIEGDVVRGSVMAGQSVGMVERIEPVADIIAELIGQAKKYINKAS